MRIIFIFCLLLMIPTTYAQAQPAAAGCDEATEAGRHTYDANEFYFCRDHVVGWEALNDISTASGGGGGQTPYFLKDYNGTTVGEVMSIASVNSGASLRLIYMDDTTNTPGTIELDEFATPTDSFRFMNTTYFENANCTGTPMGSGVIDTYIACTGAATCTTDIYIVDEDSSYTTRSYGSRRSNNGSCNATSSGSRSLYLLQPLSTEKYPCNDLSNLAAFSCTIEP